MVTVTSLDFEMVGLWLLGYKSGKCFQYIPAAGQYIMASGTYTGGNTALWVLIQEYAATGV